MTVTRVGTDSWYSSLTGENYESELAARHYDKLEHMRSSPESEGSKLLDSLSTAQIKSLVTEMNILADQVKGVPNWKQVQEDFVAANPDFLASPANGSALCAVLVERGKLTPDGVFWGTMDDIQEVYLDLAEKGMLQMRAGTRLPKRADPAEAYELPMEEVKRRAMGW